MEENKLNILLTDDVKDFIRSLPEKARKKVTYNIRRVESGEVDKDLFKKSIMRYGNFVHRSTVCVTGY